MLYDQQASTVYSALHDKVSFAKELPQDVLDYYRDVVLYRVYTYAKSYGTTMTALLQSGMFGTSYDSIDESGALYVLTAHPLWRDAEPAALPALRRPRHHHQEPLQDLPRHRQNFRPQDAGGQDPGLRRSSATGRCWPRYLHCCLPGPKTPARANTLPLPWRRCCTAAWRGWAARGPWVRWAPCRMPLAARCRF